MRATDIDKIANAVVGSLAGSGSGLLGCGSLSSPIAFDVDYMGCGLFECGGAAAFTCSSSYRCGQPNGVATPFVCDQSFTCEADYGTIIQPPCLSIADLYECGDLSEIFALK